MVLSAKAVDGALALLKQKAAAVKNKDPEGSPSEATVPGEPAPAPKAPAKTLPKKRPNPKTTPKSEASATKEKADNETKEAPVAKAKPAAAKKAKAKAKDTPQEERLTDAMPHYTWNDIQQLMADFELEEPEARQVLEDICGPDPEKEKTKQKKRLKPASDVPAAAPEATSPPEAPTASAPPKRVRKKSPEVLVLLKSSVNKVFFELFDIYIYI